MPDETEETDYVMCDECTLQQSFEESIRELNKYPKALLVAYLASRDECSLALLELP